MDDSNVENLELLELVEKLSQDPEREPVASEISVLQSIFGDGAIKLYHPNNGDADNHRPTKTDPNTIRYEVIINLPDPHEDIPIRILVSLPPSYPASSPPQLQLLSKYIGAFGVDADLFGSVLRTFISKNGIEFTPDVVCVFDGIEAVIETCVKWYEEKLSIEKAGELVRGEERELKPRPKPQESEQGDHVYDRTDGPSIPAELPVGIEMIVAEPILDRKSVFVGRACRLSDPSQVPFILNYLMSDRRIARAAHPIINAWRVQVGNVLHQDNDDDGETAAGGRLAHLLQILEVTNVLVVVTRYFGGIHLGPDRFKHINQVARNALELGGFLEQTSQAPSSEGSKAKARKR